MSNALALELTRQLLRWLSIYLIGLGLPADLAALVAHPDIVANVAATAFLMLAETGWIMTKIRKHREGRRVAH